MIESSLNEALPNSTNTPFVFLKPPENFNPKFEVAACFISVKDNFLFMRYQPHKPEGAVWGIPGGKIEKGESAGQAVVREVKEETGLDISASTLKLLGKVYIRIPQLDFVYFMFSQEIAEYPIKVDIIPTEHSEYRWITLKEALELPLIRGEEECIYLAYSKELAPLSN